MTAIAGFGGSIKLGGTGGTNTVVSVKDWDLPLAADMADVSALGSQWKAYLSLLTGALAKVNAFFDPTDTNGQMALQNALLNGTTVIVNLYVTASHYYSGTAYIKQIDIKAAVNATVDVALDIQFTGQISYT